METEEKNSLDGTIPHYSTDTKGTTTGKMLRCWDLGMKCPDEIRAELPLRSAPDGKVSSGKLFAFVRKKCARIPARQSRTPGLPGRFQSGVSLVWRVCYRLAAIES